MPETEDLTEAEQSAIFNAFARTTGTNNVSPLLAAVHDIVEARMADAWDEGYQHGYEDDGGPNPHRAIEETP